MKQDITATSVASSSSASRGPTMDTESRPSRKRAADVAGDGYLGLDESMDITTVNEQGVQWDFTDVEMRNEAFRKIVVEKPFLLMGAHPCASWRSKSNASWSRMTQREKDDELHRARVHTCSLFVACTSCSTMKDGTSYMNTAKASCHGGKIAWSGDDRCEPDVCQSR